MTEPTAFLDNFAHWLAHRLIDLPVRPTGDAEAGEGLRENADGIEQVVALYRWRGADWPSTRSRLQAMATDLMEAVAGGCDCKAFEACKSIVAWGGSWQPTRGAAKDLQTLHNKGNLTSYLLTTRRAFHLTEGGESKIKQCVSSMGSSLSKVHALNSEDGLPIYDSRVAAAISALAEMYRRQVLRSPTLPAALCFPAAPDRPTSRPEDRNRRKVHRLFASDAFDPGAIHAKQTFKWCSAIHRLGLLMKATLLHEPGLLASEGDLTKRMRALEAGFFMIGYDLKYLRG